MCEPTRKVDKDGGSFFIGDAGDVWFPPFPLKNSYEEQLNIIKNVPMRDDDIILTDYGKSGSHWHYEILNMLLKGKAEYTSVSKPEAMLDKSSLEELEALPSPRILNTHVLFRHFPKEAIQKRNKIILLTRNPKDVCVSMFNHMRDWTKGGYTGTWDNFVELFLDTGLWYGSWFETMVDWSQALSENPELPVFVSSYEDMQKDPVGQTYKLSTFLGLDRSLSLCQEIAQKCSFAKLKKASQTLHQNSFPPGTWKEGSPGFFRKGQVGDWKNWLTTEQNAKIDQVFERYRQGIAMDIVFEL